MLSSTHCMYMENYSSSSKSFFEYELVKTILYLNELLFSDFNKAKTWLVCKQLQM